MNRQQELRNKLRAKIGAKRISRSSKQSKEKILEKTLKKVGIDKDKLKADIEALGGLNLSKKLKYAS